jgi:ABC-2 type transport system ATP-binding protein
MIETRALRKVYPASSRRRSTPSRGTPTPASGVPQIGARRHSGEIAALDGLDLAVREGEFFGLLGPNGAGKTTTIGVLTTRVNATSGEAFVAGKNVVTDQVAVRRRIGVVPQRPNPDLELFEIADRADAKVDDLSGGQQQRLMIARALLHEPRVIFLDEPTVGLDPQARLALWDILRILHAQGRTIVMTTHYMQEADELCDRLAIVDRGKLLALDTPSKLRLQAPGSTLIDLTIDGDVAAAANLCRRLSGVQRVDESAGEIRAYSDRGGEILPALIHAVEEAGCRVQNINLAKPSLETLFVELTGRKLA